MMQYIELAKYANSPEINRFRSGNNFIEIKERIVTIDLENDDQILMHFEGAKVLVKISKSQNTIRKVISIVEIENLLKEYGLHNAVDTIINNVPYLRKTLVS